MSEDLRRVHRAYVEAGIMPLKDYVAEYLADDKAEYEGTKPLRFPMWDCCVNAPPVPEGFKQVMRLMGIEAVGLIINSSTGFTVTDKHGRTYTFQLSRFKIQE